MGSCIISLEMGQKCDCGRSERLRFLGRVGADKALRRTLAGGVSLNASYARKTSLNL